MSSFAQLSLGLAQLAAMAVGLVVVYEVCFRIGRARPDEVRDARRSQADLAVTALLTILGLLLAFSFELGASQFEKRRDLVVEDANAITTTYLRADLLRPPHDEHARGVLRQYIARRASVKTLDELNAAIREASKLNADLWSEAVRAGHESYDSPIVGRFIDSLNKMIDLEATEVNASWYQRLPRAIFWVLYLVSFASIGMFGIRGGLDRCRGLISASVLIVIIVTVIGLIDSLDNPASRLFDISQHAIHDAQQMMTSSTVRASS
jgi:hypothetical protein